MLLSLLRKPKSATISAVNIRLSGRTSPLFSTLGHQPLLSSAEVQPLTKSALQSLVLSHYHHGKFRSLLQNVVASPSLLLTACHNLRKHAPDSLPPPLTLDWVSAQFFSLQELSFQLSESSLDVESCCVSVFPEARRGTPLVLPNLKLKVVLEAIRIVLEVIYDDRFATFSYGGRANMGRHTAVRYLKNSVENPREKIEDSELLDFIRRLFECQVVAINLGGVCLGRGLPQEYALSSILINVYLNGFDKEVQDLRLKMNKENPDFKENELVPGESSSVNFL
ncbi:Nuclear intron maturase 3, mitochondrial [Sesamum angolense]|uniref:Nuclear intron maturase 3, mitochondrial n=1 Tax=Sesamum angolense TaxID=2727404 RepID=A0AAE2BP15_9LAMI|nr:Nuclear intron maturase 3, mitochondrial [Sesamum angolense]